MTRYYNPQQDSLRFGSILSWRSTIFNHVFTTREYWICLFFHVCMVLICKRSMKEASSVAEFRWEVTSTMQYFLIFFITFYNDTCYHRYMNRMYPMCCDLVDSVVMFVEEMTVSLHYDELKQHRLAMSKYLLASVHEFFMTVTGGKLTKACWRELTKKGVLTGSEATMLARYPGRQATLVLASWIMLIVRDALLQDCIWRGVQAGTRLPAVQGAAICREDAQADYKLRPGQEVVSDGCPNADGIVRIREPVAGTLHILQTTGWRYPRTPQGPDSVHIYDRLNRHIVSIVGCTDGVASLIALPVPFAYFHLVCLTIGFNTLAIATIPALFQSWGTVPLYAGALLVVMGIKTISSALADPFGEDDVDFPVPDFINHAFDRVVCLLLAFTSGEARNSVIARIHDGTDFIQTGLRHKLDAETVRSGWGTFGTWHDTPTIAKIPRQSDPAVFLEQAFVLVGKDKATEAVREEPEPSSTIWKQMLSEQQDALVRAKAAGEDLQREVDALWCELEQLRDLQAIGGRGPPEQRRPADSDRAAREAHAKRRAN